MKGVTMNDEKEFLDTKEVAEKYGLKVGTLGQWRHKKKNLPFYKIGDKVLYKKTEIEAFLEKGKVQCKNKV